MSKDACKWKVSTTDLLREIADAGLPRSMGVMKIPLNIFQSLLAAVAERAIIINDLELNKLMIRLGLYENFNSQEMINYLDKEE